MGADEGARVTVPSSSLLCQLIGTSIDGVNAVALMRQGKLVAAYTRPGLATPPEEKIMRMLFQVEVVAAIADSQSDVFGELEYLVLNYRERRVWVFKTVHGTLAFSLVGQRPLQERVIEQVREILGRFG
ncbi:hypothetical protein [Nitrososphaera sp.]|uniref:hypothetical protein n=1 Tax=Nitrososphaera sp. TaxID=1971748 RepID=UPI00307E00E2